MKISKKFWCRNLSTVSKKLFLLIVFCSFLFSGSINGERHYASSVGRFLAQNDTGREARKLWEKLLASATDYNVRAVPKKVTWGAEKEASSSLITRVMGITSEAFEEVVFDYLPEAERTQFLRDFLGKWVNGTYRRYRNEAGHLVDLSTDVLDLDGNAKTISLDGLRGIDYQTATPQVLEDKFRLWLSRTHDRPWSFVSPRTRVKMFLKELPGQTDHFLPRYGSSWIPNFGRAQRYIDSVHTQSKGWEINFKAMDTYGEFEEMVLWFRKTLERNGQLFQAPGHHWMVFHKPPGFNEAKFAEALKITQAIIVLDGIAGGTGIENANFKHVHPDYSILRQGYLGRGVIRVDRDRNLFGAGTIGVELRAGTKDIKTARFIEMALAARVATNDFAGLADAASWTLYNGNGFDAESLVRRFGVDQSVANRAISKFSTARLDWSYLVPLWNWEDAACPFMSDTKRTILNGLTKDFITSVAGMSERGEATVKKKLRQLMRTWVKTSALKDDLRQYFVPQELLTNRSRRHLFRMPRGRNYITHPINVNKVDLGIEYSGKFPLRIEVERSEEVTSAGRHAWLATYVDLSPEEREAVIEKIAHDLKVHLNGRSVSKIEDGGGHGHGLELQYEVVDSKGRSWRVEWDGISREYTPDGQIVDASARGGSIELVTPKFEPTMKEMQSVFKAFADNNIIPSLKVGGGHINFDLAVFQGKPKQFARFLSLFHEHRSVISLMFQHIHRVRTSEPVFISERLAEALRDFDGTEDELKKLLYNEQYFNARVGRKTRYIQLDVSAYFQDVIPPQFVTEDFDVMSPTTLWRKQFRVDPRIRKGEFRLFNAPRDALESALQSKLVRALLSKALNETDEIPGTVQNKTHEFYLEHIDEAYDDLKKMCQQLGLNEKEYRVFVAEGLSETDIYTRSSFYQTFEEKMVDYPKVRGWRRAVRPRGEEDAISSKGRLWNEAEVDHEALVLQRKRVQIAQEAARFRGRYELAEILAEKLHRVTSCAGLIRGFLP